MMTMTQDWLNHLNNAQRQAVTHPAGPLLVLAGAGSGKTRVLTHRIAYLIAEEGVAPHQIVAMTFTNKAAQEMRERVDHLLEGQAPGQGSQVTISTFHSLGARILRRHAPAAGLSWSFSIYDDADQRRLITRVLDEAGDERARADVRRLQSYIDACKNRGWTPDQAHEHAHDARAEADAELYAHYQRALAQAGAVDFGDLILGVLSLFRNHPQLARQYSSRWQHVLVDEFQDTNPAQYEFLDHLTSVHNNLTVVGDDDQAIYRWRGATVANILGFEDANESAARVKLEQNYRSTSLILEAANDVIARNDRRHAKKLWTERQGGEPIVAFTGADDREEAAYVAETIFDMTRQGADYDDFAIFYRTNAQGRLFEEQLRSWGVPYRIVGGLSFYAREEIKDLLAYLRCALNPNDDVATARVINTPRRGVGKTTLEKLAQATSVQGVESLQNALLLALEDRPAQNDLFATRRPRPRNPAERMLVETVEELSGVSRRGIQEFWEILQATRDDLLHYEELTPILERLIERISYFEHLERTDSESAEDRIRNVGELLSAIEEFERDPNSIALIEAVQEAMPDDLDDLLTTAPASLRLRAFLDRSALVQSTDQEGASGQAVTMMTIHGSKGLEFRTVFVAGLEEETFPSLRDQNDAEELAEERRLAYVAITRARDRLYLTNARRRRVYGQFKDTVPSRFLLDIAPERLIIDPRSAAKELDYARDRRQRLGHPSHEFPAPQIPAQHSPGFDFNQAPAADEAFSQESFAQEQPDWESNFSQTPDAWDVRTTPTGDDQLIGATVSHTKFGIGEVVAISGQGDKARLTIDFPAVGQQTVIRKFLKILG
ncbi:hypothetical protein DL240_01835 [Lujinxingia litoralis]|uniref:DNA 3'-5' helicase n=1 Tax=Lujinxingia litoralis TaxID=2211119 RepID=A0A328C938_9DELT|nr:UvrD-helicase domain-containing protein [Lujinxingia litoralis]RAL24975.1 hypothetical protein DL240_01835 [Lujinxingia litoralis]